MIPPRIAAPLPGEHLAGVWPRTAEETAATWHRRLNVFPGRTLTEPALAAEQRVRAGRFALLGQLLAPGVLHGLEVGLERTVQRERVGDGEAAAMRDVVRHLLHVAPGAGLTAGGEDVTVARPVRANLADVPVNAPAALRFGDAPPEEDGDAGAAVARREWGPLGDLLRRGARLPAAAVLVLQPVDVESMLAPDDGDPCGPGSTDPCARDEASEAFDDRQRVDGCRLVLYAWPVEQVPLPAPGARWRNRLAYALFDAESQRAPEPPPWAEGGVPVALVAFDTTVAPGRDVRWERGELSWTPLFVDRGAVARAGGMPRERRVLRGRAWLPALWHARVHQFAEQVAGTDFAATPLAELSSHFRHLPPVGVLPTGLVDARAGRDLFFPAGWTVTAAPVPTEQLDVLFDESAALAPYDLDQADEVRVYVPVPQASYDPALLVVEAVDEEFGRALAEFGLRRGRWLGRRATVRAMASALARALGGRPRDFPDPDPEALEPEEAVHDAADPNDPTREHVEARHGTTAADDGTVTADAMAALHADLRRTAPLRDADHAQLDALGVRGFVGYLERAAAAADDRIDLGFVRVQTDIYRVRQLMLGTIGASRLATSPALADIAQGTSARATQEALDDFVARTRPAGAPVGGGEPGGEGGGLVSGTGEPAGPVLRGAISHASAAIEAARAGASSAGGERMVAGTLREAAGAGGIGRLGDVGGLRAVGGVADIGGLAGPIVGGSVIGGAPIAAALGDVSRIGDAAFVSAQSRASALNVPLPPTPADVTQQSPIVGKALEFRTVSVAERLRQPPAPESKSFGVASKYTVLTELADLAINVDDLQVPGFLNADRQEVRRPLADVRGDLGAEILAERHDPDPANGDEGAFFAATVRALDHTIATLRLVEGRVQAYRAAIERVRRTLAELERHLAAADARLLVIRDELAEARQDVATARALLREEESRVAAVNGRRDAILREHVEFLVYQRPRAADLVLDLPARTLDPAAVPAAEPACMRGDVTVPPELQAMVALLRDAPTGWLVAAPPILDRLDRVDTLVRALDGVRAKALRAPAPAASSASAMHAAGLATAIGSLIGAQQRTLAAHRLAAVQVDVAGDAASWTRARDGALLVVSLGDLMDGLHGRADVARDAAREVDRLSRAAGCLYEHFGAVSPAIRLVWAERLGQYDAPANLRNLASLPRWGELDVLDRRAMQGLVDWLFGRVDPRRAEAVALANDVVRVAILLASHAPVSRIVAGRVRRPTPVRPGVRVEIAVDVSRVHVGMAVRLFDGAAAVARAVVDDLADGVAAVRVLDAPAGGATLAAGATAQFGGLAALGLTGRGG